MAKMASGKNVLLFVVILFLMACVLEIREVQGRGRRNRNQGQNQTEIMKLLKKLQARVDQLETQLKSELRGRPGRPGRNGQHGPPGARGKTGTKGPIGPIGHTGVKGSKGDSGPVGVQYVRWGRTTCPWGASLVYKGRIGGDHYLHTGGGSNYVCLPENPRYARYKNGYQFPAMMYGTEYELYLSNPFTRNLQNHEAPCAVCYVTTRSAKMMIPATYACPAGWIREYHGYLMSAGYDNKHSSEYICVDHYAEAVPGTRANLNGALLSPVEGRCAALPCLPYVGGRELTCSVCTK